MYNLEKLTDSLQKNGFVVSHFATGKEAAEYLNKKIDNTTVGFGGSISITDIGLIEMLREHNKIVSHWQGDSVYDAVVTNTYISSANGLAETGEIINIDGSGNRVASLSFGHENIYLVVGSNKVAEDYDKALYRARNIAAPKNAQRLKRNTPCAVKGDKCYNCNSEERICRSLSVLWKKPTSCKYFEIVLVDEELGY